LQLWLWFYFWLLVLVEQAAEQGADHKQSETEAVHRERRQHQQGQG